MTQIQTEQTNKEQATVNQGIPAKTYVLDTTVLINEPDIVSRLKGKVVVPLVVIGQLDGLKNNEDATKAQKARQASRAILEAQKEGKVRVINNFKKGINVLDSEADNKIIGTCLTLKEQGEDVNLLTTDVNMQITAKSMGVGTEQGEKEVDWTLIIIISLGVGFFISIGLTMAIYSLAPSVVFHEIFISVVALILPTTVILLSIFKPKGILKNGLDPRFARHSARERKSDWYPGGPDPTMPGDIGYIDPNRHYG